MKRARVRDVRDQPADDAAEADAEVHRQALLRERGVAPRGRREPRDQRRLARPEARRADALDRDQHERLPRLADEREEPEADRLQHEPAAQRQPRARRGRSTSPATMPAASSAADDDARRSSPPCRARTRARRGGR